MISLGQSLYARISGLFLLLLLSFFVLAVAFMAREFSAFLEELEQRLNRGLAAHIANELEPHVMSDLQSEAAREAMQRVLAINPALDIYALANDGDVLAAYPPKEGLALQRVDTTPIRQFLSDDPMLPIRGRDPANSGELKVFSAATLRLPADEPGYLYAILRGQPLETAASMLQNSYILRTLAVALLLALLAVAVAGFLLFAHLTRRFRRLIGTVQGYRDGHYDRRSTIGGNDEIGQLAAAVNDMAATIEAQLEALRRTDDDRRLLVANLSHDFRTPLTSLRGYAQRLADEWQRLDQAARDDCLQAIVSNTQQLEHLASQLASVSRLDTGRASTQMEEFSLDELVQDIAIQFRPAADAAGLELGTEHSPSPPAWGDIGLVERVISNLIDNAINNTPAGGTVTVSVQHDDERVQVTVSDNGHGIEADELGLVRQRFYRTARSRQEAAAGSGLGLAIASDILELHGASLAMQSQPGQGTSASFSLAIAAAREPS